MPSKKSNLKLNHSQGIIEFEAIGTHWTIELFDRVQDLDSLSSHILSRIHIFDKTYSRFRDDSIVTKASLSPGEYTFPEDARELFELYESFYKITSGKMTPLIGQLVSDAGYDKDYSLVPKKLSKTPKWDDVMNYSHPVLSVHTPVLLDFGACGKGYLVDIVGELLKGIGLTSFCINAGGDILVSGRELQIALEDPSDTSSAVGVITLGSGSLCGSSGNRRTWESFNHIFDPHEMSSVNHYKAVWTRATTTMLADALSTALYFVDPQTLSRHFEFEYAIIHQDSSLTYSANFGADFF